MWWAKEGKGRGLRLSQRAVKIRPALLMMTLDVMFIWGVYTSLVILRFDADLPDNYWSGFGWFLAAAFLVHLSVNWAFGLYSAIWRFASMNEARRLLGAGLVSMAILIGLSLVDRSTVPLSLPIVGGIVVTGSVGLLRFQSRLFAHRRHSRKKQDRRRIGVIGAGSGGAQVVRAMLQDDAQGYEPVFFVDDDPRKHGLKMFGLPVFGPISKVGELTDEIDSLLLAIPGADGPTIRRVLDQVESVGLPVKVLPNLGYMVDGPISMRDVRDLEVADLLGRPEVSTDLDCVRSMISGRCILVTGGGGSIGSEIARQVSAFGPGRLVLLDSDETHLHDAMAKLDGGVRAESLLANIRDRRRILSVFEEVRPDVVLHAAALKHVPVLETHATEAVKTNIEGMDHVVDAAVATDVRRFVFISTDKAVNPSSVMGATKWFGEQIMLSRAPEGSSWSCVRFGNVLGSRGSVLPTFERQIRDGGPVTVTDARMTRFFMSVQEAVQLVLQAGAMSSGHNIYMLEMGEPVRILELAERMIRMTGNEPYVDIHIVISGIRGGEKLAEELFTSGEEACETEHRSIRELSPVRVQPSTIQTQLQSLRRAIDDGASDEHLARMVMAFARHTDCSVIDLRSRVMDEYVSRSS